MNFYFCETCGKRITDVDIQQGAGKNKKLKGYYCISCAAGVQTMDLPALTDDEAREHLAAIEAPKPKSAIGTPLRGSPRVPSSRVANSRREVAEQTPGQGNRTTIIASVAAAGVLFCVAMWMMLRSPARPPDSAPAAVVRAGPPPPALVEERNSAEVAAVKIDTKLTPVQQTAATTPPPASAFTTSIGEDIRETIARKRLNDLSDQEKSGKLSAAQIYAQYTYLATSSYRSTKAGQEAAEKLKTLPVPPPEAVVAAQAVTGETKSIAAGNGVWWEGEDAIENDFVSHIWMAEQNLDKGKISAGKYLNHLNDATWLSSKGKAMAKSLFARYVVDVPADGTYTLWVREYDPYSAAPWKFKWDDGKWFEVPPGQPYQDKVEFGKDRWLVWRNYPNQVLTKGKHAFRLEVNMEKHGVSAFDCFLLTTEAFKPDGPRKP